MEGLYRKTPLMGWASWNCFRTDISEQKLKAQIDALISTGLADCGYEYFNIDDGFFGGRDENGRLMIHKTRFPNGIKVMADYAHERGLKAGIYSEAGDNTCGHYYDNEGDNGKGVGLYGHEEEDLSMYFEEFGFDFLKVDWCGGVRLGLDEEEQYSKIGQIIDNIRHRTGRCLVYNICRWQFPGPWAARVADSWRTGADIAPDFGSVIHQIDVIKPLGRYCGPGHVNDLDMMQIGNGGMTYEEQKTHFSMWCMMSTPLMIGCDLTKADEKTLEIFKNRELIEINQDAACLQAFVIKEYRNESCELEGEIWIKDLGVKNSNKKAIAFLNRSDSEIEMELALDDAGLVGKVLGARDLNRHEDIKCGSLVKTLVKTHEAVVLKIETEGSRPVADMHDIGEYEFKCADKITLEKAKSLAADGARLVDVRTRAEFEKGHLDGAVNIPYMDIHAIAQMVIPDKDAAVVVYCATGKRSMQARNSLEYLGYKNVYYLGGVENL